MHTIRTVTEGMVEEERLVCDEPSQVLLSRRRRSTETLSPPRGVARLAGDFVVCFDEVSGEIVA